MYFEQFTLVELAEVYTNVDLSTLFWHNHSGAPGCWFIHFLDDTQGHQALEFSFDFIVQRQGHIPGSKNAKGLALFFILIIYSRWKLPTISKSNEN